jgi:hypothetical protein
MARNSMSIKSLVKTGFGISVGMFLAQMIFLLFGMVFFIPGYLIFSKKSDKEESGGSKIGGIVLMAIGVIIMGGAGFGTLMDSLGGLDF